MHHNIWCFSLCFLQKFVCNVTDNTSNIKIDHFVSKIGSTNTFYLRVGLCFYDDDDDDDDCWCLSAHS